MKKLYPLKLFLFFLLFAGSYAALFYILKGSIAAQFDASAPADMLGLKNFGMLGGDETKETFETYGALGGLALGIIPLAVSFVIWGIASIFHAGKNIWLRFIAPILSYGILLFFAVEFLFFEIRTTALVRSIIYYVGTPMLYASLITIIVVLIIGLISAFKKNPHTKKLAFLLVLALPTMTGCSLISDLTATTCSFGVDDTHCYQEAAISGNDESKCEKVQPPEEFKNSGSNPPQDKCYMIVAENKKDPEICNKMKGGIGSYEKTECIQEIVDFEQTFVNSMMEAAKNDQTPDPKSIDEMQAKLNRMQRMYDSMSNIQKQMHDMQMATVQNFR